MATWKDVVAIGRELEGVEAGTWMRKDPETLVVPVGGLDEKEALLQGQPDVFTTTPHYDKSAMVLVRLEAIEREQLAELLEDAWRLRRGARGGARRPR